MICDLMDIPEITPDEILAVYARMAPRRRLRAESQFQRVALPAWNKCNVPNLEDPEDIRRIHETAKSTPTGRKWVSAVLYAREFLEALRNQRPDAYLDLISFLASRGFRIRKDKPAC